jgi:branched-chain amino acid transport system ATP-binding protein
MTHPALMLLDEPSMGLAPILVEEIFMIVRDLNQNEGITFLVAEQNTTFALRYTDRAIVIGNWPDGGQRDRERDFCSR